MRFFFVKKNSKKIDFMKIKCYYKLNILEKRRIVMIEIIICDDNYNLNYT